MTRGCEANVVANVVQATDPEKDAPVLSVGRGPLVLQHLRHSPSSPNSRKVHTLLDPSMAPPPPPALLRLSPTLRSTLLLLPWLILQGSPGGAFQSPGITISASLPSHMPSSSFSPSLTCWLFLIYPSWPFQSALRCTLDSLLHLHSGAALQHKTSSVCPTSLLGWPRETWHLIGGARALDPTNASFSLSFSLLGTWHHDFPSCLIQSLRIHPGLSLFFIPYTQPICKTH